jgi:hypothetical protein
MLYSSTATEAIVTKDEIQNEKRLENENTILRYYFGFDFFLKKNQDRCRVTFCDFKFIYIYYKTSY